MASLNSARRRRRLRRHKQAPSASRFLLIVAGVFLGLILFVTLSVGAVTGGAYMYLTSDLPNPEELTEFPVSESSKIYDRNGRLLYTINNPTEGQRTILSFDEIPSVMKLAIIAAEDRGFYSNPGFDLRGIARAVLGVVTGRYAGGGSTITQQLARAVFLTPEFSVERKLKEIILAYEISQRYSKDETLALYLNLIAFGNLAYGIEAAANVYFDKPAQELTLAEAAMLAGIVQAPSGLNPFVNKEGARERQLYVLNQMVENEFITEAQPRRPTLTSPHIVNAANLCSRPTSSSTYASCWRNGTAPNDSTVAACTLLRHSISICRAWLNALRGSRSQGSSRTMPAMPPSSP